MPQSEPSDFEFDVSDLDVETPDSAPKPGDDGAVVSEQAVDAEPETEAESEIDRDELAVEESVAAQREAMADAVGESAPEAPPEDLDDIAAASFDIAELPEIFSSPEAIPASEPEAEAREVEVELAPGRQPQTLRALGEDDLGADVFAELAAQEIGEDAKLDFEDALEDLLSEVDAFETGADADAFGADGAPGSELDEDGLPLRPAHADDDELTARQAGREAGKLQPAAAPLASANPGGPVPLPADPKPDSPLQAPLFDTIPSDEQLEPEPPPSDAEEAEPAAAETEDAAVEPEPLAGEPELFVPEPEAESEAAPPEAEAESPELEVASDAFDFASLAIEADEAAAPEAVELAEAEAPAESAPLPVQEVAEEAVEPAASEAAPAEAPGLAVMDDDDEEIVSMPSAEDLLRHAGSLFNTGAAPTMSVEDEEGDDEVVSLPNFAALSQQLEEAPPPAASPAEAVASAEEDDDGPFAAMPDPAALIAQAAAQSEANAPAKAPAAAKTFSGNVADRAGNLPPPPPAPVEIIDDDPLDVDPAPYIPPPEPELQPISPEIKDPFANDDALDGFNIGFENPDDLEEALSAQLAAAPEARPEEERSDSGRAPKVAKAPKPSFLWRITHSLAVAAGLALVGLGWLLSAWRQEIMEYIDGRDLDASRLVAQIRNIGLHALEGFDEAGLYRMQWLDSDLRAVSRNELRLHARIAAQLREDLYAPTFESYVEERFDIDFSQLEQARMAASQATAGDLPEPPEKPWESLYQLATPRGEILLLRAVYQIVRESADADWEFKGVRLAGYDQDLVWPSGQPRSKFGDRAFDVDSAAFANVLASYREQSENYVARVAALSDAASSARVAALREVEGRRQRVRQSMSKGAYFSGVAILGEDAAASEDITMLITATEGDGAMVRGVFKRDGEGAAPKHFVGSLNFLSPDGGAEIGVLSVTTVAFDGAGGGLGGPPFFNPGTVSRIRLKTDGIQLEGDTPDISLRLHRAM